MAITLAVGSTSVELPPDLYWEDEFWTPVVQKNKRSITGAMVVSTAMKQGGRPITLRPEDDHSAGIKLVDMLQVQEWAQIEGQEMELTLRGVTRTVIFDHEATGLAPIPFVHFREMDGTDYYLATFRFLETE